jgi:hypothetical protein
VEPGGAGDSSVCCRAPAARNGAGGVGDPMGAKQDEVGAAGGRKLDRMVKGDGTLVRVRAAVWPCIGVPQ